MQDVMLLRKTVLGILIAVALASSLLGVALSGWDWGALLLNAGTEMAGAVTTYILLEMVIGRREKHESEKASLIAEKANLIARMGSSVQDVALAAAEELDRRGWLTDGSLRSARLREANLPKVNLWRADLHRADLTEAVLENANLGEANLQHARLGLANLQSAYLAEADLRNAFLYSANLFDANLVDADLRGADLREAILYGAEFYGAKFDETTILPDGTKWTPESDISQFTPYRPLLRRFA